MGSKVEIKQRAWRHGIDNRISKENVGEKVRNGRRTVESRRVEKREKRENGSSKGGRKHGKGTNKIYRAYAS